MEGELINPNPPPKNRILATPRRGGRFPTICLLKRGYLRRHIRVRRVDDCIVDARAADGEVVG